MGASLHDFFQDAANREAVGRALPKGSSVQFDLTSDAGAIGTWTLKRTEDHVDLVHESQDHPDCHLRCSEHDFRGLIDGTLDPSDAFLAGQLEITGDVGIVLQLRRAVLEP